MSSVLFRMICMVLLVFTTIAPSIAVAEVNNEFDIDINAGSENRDIIDASDNIQSKKQGDWEYILKEDNSITITSYLGSQTIVEVPAIIDGKDVTHIEGYDYSTITDITFPSTIEFIDQSIFYGGLVENINVDVNNNHYKSEEGVLFTKDMEKLISYPMGNSKIKYQVPQGVNIIEFNAFSTTIYNGSTDLKTIEIPSSVSSIKDIHSLAARIANIEVQPGNETYKSIDGVLFNKAGDVLICYPYANTRTDYSVPEGTKNISNQGFYGTYGKEHYLTNLNLPASLETFPADFQIEKLQGIQVEPNSSYFTSVEGVLFTKNMQVLISYPMGKKEESYIIPSGVKEVEFGAFYDIYQFPRHLLKEITIPDSLQDFGDSLHQGWENIFVEENHTKLKSVSGVLYSIDGKRLIKYPRLKQSVFFSIPVGTESIESSAFFSCNYLGKLIIPDSVTLIVQDSTNWCENLTDVVIYNNNIEIKDSNFLGRKGITIWGSEGSTSYTYAKVNNLNFRLLNESMNADLSSLTLSRGTQDIIFTSETTEYDASVDNEVNSITITPTAVEQQSVIKVNDIAVSSGLESQEINLEIGRNTIRVEVTAPDGVSTKIYAITVTRTDSMKVLDSIAVTELPKKTKYKVAESLDLTGIEVTAIYDDESTSIIELMNNMVTGFDSNEVESEQLLTVTYEDKIATFMVDILAASQTGSNPTTWPVDKNLTASDTTKTVTTLSWTPAEDDIGVTGYRIYKDGLLIHNVTGTTNVYEVTELSPNTIYNFQIQAGNAAGNWTTNGPSVAVLTNVDGLSDNGSTGTNGSSGNSGNGGSVTPNPVTPPVVPDTAIGKEVIDPVTGDKTVIIGGESLVDQIKNQQQKEIIIPLSAKQDELVKSLSATIDQAVLKQIIDSNKPLAITANGAKMQISNETLKAIDVTDGESIKISVSVLEDTDKLPKISKRQTLLSSLYDFNIVVTKETKERKVINFTKPITITMNIGQVKNAEKVAAFYLNEKDSGWEYIGGNLARGMFTFSTTHFSKFAVLENDRTFNDIHNQKVEWAADYIEVLASKNIIQGKTEDTFAPSDDITRAQFAALLSRALNLPKQPYAATFSDVSSTNWSAQDIEAANRVGIVQGEKGEFKPNEKITRQQMATMIIRAIQYRDPTSLNDVTSTLSFKDASLISDYAKEYVGLSASLGIISGRDDKGSFVFAPKENATRAHAAKMLYKFIEME
ncbi:S-layer homology domain-containing protein [Sporosarcina sp. E16_8]|uniref:S-layer homology domain-containing protein n=1 Tax=Sporosarcina sp. E16_8 TaxID=2789295 RepID=UPI00210594A9|nr:S-layer homology domain-containing protein [Sporosarcina sp. E16_8]